MYFWTGRFQGNQFRSNLPIISLWRKACPFIFDKPFIKWFFVQCKRSGLNRPSGNEADFWELPKLQCQFCCYAIISLRECLVWMLCVNFDWKWPNDFHQRYKKCVKFPDRSTDRRTRRLQTKCCCYFIDWLTDHSEVTPYLLLDVIWCIAL